MEPKLVIVEGGSYALPFSIYLERQYGFKLIGYDPAAEEFKGLIDKIVFSAASPRICIVRGHLTALARKQITPAWFREFEMAVAMAGCRLILTTARDVDPSGYLAEPYARSWLEKMALDDGRELDDVVDWLGLGEGARRAS
jgi:hypothetical protein